MRPRSQPCTASISAHPDRARDSWRCDRGAGSACPAPRRPARPPARRRPGGVEQGLAFRHLHHRLQPQRRAQRLDPAQHALAGEDAGALGQPQHQPAAVAAAARCRPAAPGCRRTACRPAAAPPPAPPPGGSSARPAAPGSAPGRARSARPRSAAPRPGARKARAWWSSPTPCCRSTRRKACSARYSGWSWLPMSETQQAASRSARGIGVLAGEDRVGPGQQRRRQAGVAAPAPGQLLRGRQQRLLPRGSPAGSSRAYQPSRSPLAEKTTRPAPVARSSRRSATAAKGRSPSRFCGAPGHAFQRPPRGRHHHAGEVARLLPPQHVVVDDGQRVAGLGDVHPRHAPARRRRPGRGRARRPRPARASGPAPARRSPGRGPRRRRPAPPAG